MGIDYGSNLMIGEMFTYKEDDFPLDFEIFEENGLDYDGDMMSNSYICVGVSLASTDEYTDDYIAIEDVENYDFIEEKITEKLQFLFPDRKLNVQMYLVSTIS